MSVYFGDPEQDRKIMKRGDYLDLPCTVEEFKNLFWSPSRDVPTSVNANGDVTDNGGISDLLVTSRDVFVSRGIAPKVDAEEVARRISEALQPLVEKMRELSTSMSKIGEILKEIGEHIKDNEEVDCPLGS
jgi:hypothetical protein